MKTLQILFFLLMVVSTASFAQKEIHVKPLGGTKGKGTFQNSYSSIEQAVQILEKSTKSMKSDIVVYLHQGRHQLTSPIVLNEKHSGKNGFKVVFKAYKDEKPTISGGVKVTNWEHVGGNVYSAKLNSDEKLRTLFVNGVRMRMAGLNEPIEGLGDWGNYEVKGNEDWAFGAGSAIDGIKFRTADVRVYHNPEDVEVIQNNVWTEKILCIRDIEQIVDTTILKFQQPYGAIATNLAWAGKINYSKKFFIRNAHELLDAPGEFYFNRKTKILYYYSSGEDMSTAEVIAPISEGLVRIEGTSNASRVKNISFEGITFSHDHWNLMEVDGSHAFAGIQSAGLAYKFVPGGNWHPTEYNSCDVPRGAIHIQNAENIVFEQNIFEGLSSATAINMVNDVKNSTINGNSFQDLLGNAIILGHPQHYKIGDGDLFAPGVEGLCENITVTNNYLRNVSLDFRQLEGIIAFFVADVKVDHNDIAETAYGAITVGWWWGNSNIPPSKVAKNNSMSFNKAGNTHRALDDGGVIYALGEQPGSVIEGNYLYNGPRSIYPDDGSAYWTIKRNVIDNVINRKWNQWLQLWSHRIHHIVAQDNFVKVNLVVDNSPDAIIENTQNFILRDFSDEAKEIMNNAGIQDKYKGIIPTEEPEVIDLYPNSFKDIHH